MQTKGFIGDKTYKGRHPALITKDPVSEKLAEHQRVSTQFFMSLKHISPKLA